MNRAELTRGYLLHRRAYRETSVIAELFTLDHGRMGTVAKGARRHRSPLRGALQAFQPRLFSWQGRGELATLTAAEASENFPPLEGDALASGFYANELLMRLLPRNDGNSALFHAYEALLDALRQTADVEPALRRFEKQLLDALGYGLELELDTRGRPVRGDQRYLYVAETGAVALGDGETGENAISGATLIALATDTLSPSAQPEAKRLMRQVLNHYLGDKPLVSRSLFRR
ncbi:MAG: DNA repair protein RecO [Pseudomonadota bacterium]